MRVTLRAWRLLDGWLLGRWKAEDVGLEVFDGLAEIRTSRGLEATVGAGDELIDTVFIVLEERMDLFFVEDAGPLRLGQDEVEEEEESDVSVEGNPGVGK